MKIVTDYQLIDHGLEHASYFQGCGVAFTDYETCVTGCGDNFSDAIKQCLENLVFMDYDGNNLAERILNEHQWNEWPAKENNSKYHLENEDCEMYYYVSIRVK